MPDKPYSVRELDTRFKSLEDKTLLGISAVAEQIVDLKEHMEMLTAPILAQTTKTNGRVAALEGWRGNMQGAWRLGTWVGLPLFAVFVGFMSWLTMQVMGIPKTISEELDNREFTISE